MQFLFKAGRHGIEYDLSNSVLSHEHIPRIGEMGPKGQKYASHSFAICSSPLYVEQTSGTPQNFKIRRVLSLILAGLFSGEWGI